MPEGDTIFKVARYLRQRLAGSTVEEGRAAPLPHLDLAGRRVEDVYAVGKHLFVEFADGGLRSHLGMHGSWHRYSSGEVWRRPRRQASIELVADGQVYVCFNAKEVEWLNRGSVREKQLASHLGPDLIADDCDPATLLARSRRYVGPADSVADVLLDQRVAAGIGNVYKNELLFLHGIHPLVPAPSVPDDTLLALYRSAQSLLRKNLGPGRRVTRFENDGQGRTWVYGRRDMPCHRCHTAIGYARLGRHWRSTYWCPRCQRDEAPNRVQATSRERA